MTRVLVIALNPSVDVEWRVPHVRWEEKNVLQSERRWPGGKGVNVARWLKHLGARPQLLIPLGGPTGKEMEDGLRREQIPTTIIPLREATRANIIVSTASQGQLRFNPPGPKLSRLEWQAILDQTRVELTSASLLIISGSLPRGLPATAYAPLIRLARQAGVRTLLDCDGPAFAAAVKARPFLVKPNEPELAQWWGQPLSSEAEILHAARNLSQASGGWVLVSRGHRGALLVNHFEERVFVAAAPAVKPRNTVGAGDALLAAVAQQVALPAGAPHWLRWGVAAGTASTPCAAGVLPERASIQRLVKRVRGTEVGLRGKSSSESANPLQQFSF